jgi:hypothetical protein
MEIGGRTMVEWKTQEEWNERDGTPYHVVKQSEAEENVAKLEAQMNGLIVDNNRLKQELEAERKFLEGFKKWARFAIDGADLSEKLEVVEDLAEGKAPRPLEWWKE